MAKAKVGSADIRVPVAVRALLQRINRKTRPASEVKRLKGRAAKIHGHFIRVDPEKGSLLGSRVDLDKYAREIGVLRPWEMVEVEK